MNSQGGLDAAGHRVTIGHAPTGFLTSAQCNLFFGDDYGDMMTRFTGSTEVMNVWAGWTYSAGNTSDYSDSSYSFEPAWSSAATGATPAPRRGGRDFYEGQ